jgi:ADP-ribose pyrophosphatase YjhB (NUDIX family)
VSTRWRPAPHVRPVAIGLVRRGNELLVVGVEDDSGATIGWRPLGGTIEPGELAADTLRREFVEETGLALAEPTLLTVIENIYEHHGTTGHEIVFVFEAAFAEPDAYRRQAFRFQDGGVDNRACWIEAERFRSGEAPLFPAGLVEMLWSRA